MRYVVALGQTIWMSIGVPKIEGAGPRPLWACLTVKKQSRTHLWYPADFGRSIGQTVGA